MTYADKGKRAQRSFAMNNIPRCATYSRYSCDNQREASIEDQIRKCRNLAASKNWEILEDHIYYDKAQSGANFDSRAGFKKMISVVMSGNCPFDKILVDDTSRIARNTKEALDVFALLRFYNIDVYYVSQGIDTSHEAAEEMITINGLIDSLYLRNLAKETHRGIEGQILKGYSGGGRRYGYRSEPVFNGKVDIYGNPKADGYRLKINVEEAEVVTRIFRLFGDEGYSAKKIVNILNRELIKGGMPKPPMGGFWSVSTILGSRPAGRGILNNELYIGKYYWNRAKKKINPVNGKKKIILKNAEDWLSICKPELRIVPDSLWQKVKARQRQIHETTKSRYTQGKPLYSKNLLTGLMTCSTCGGNMVVVSGGKFSKYGCSNNWNKGSSVCGNDKKIGKNGLEHVVIDSLCLDFNDEKSIAYLTKRANSLIDEKNLSNNQRWREKAAEDQLKRTEREIGNIINAIKFGIVNEVVKETLTEAEKKRDALEKIINDYGKRDSHNVGHIDKKLIQLYLDNLQKTLGLHPVAGKNFLQALIEKIYIKPLGKGNIKLIVFFKGKGHSESKTIVMNPIQKGPIRGIRLLKSKRYTGRDISPFASGNPKEACA
jgi:DNA invertase Pin-like site-specific DNA recombinase